MFVLQLSASECLRIDLGKHNQTSSSIQGGIYSQISITSQPQSATFGSNDTNTSEG